jgi:hypothetical protein
MSKRSAGTTRWAHPLFLPFPHRSTRHDLRRHQRLPHRGFTCKLRRPLPPSSKADLQVAATETLMAWHRLTAACRAFHHLLNTCPDLTLLHRWPFPDHRLHPDTRAASLPITPGLVWPVRRWVRHMFLSETSLDQDLHQVHRMPVLPGILQRPWRLVLHTTPFSSSFLAVCLAVLPGCRACQVCRACLLNGPHRCRRQRRRRRPRRRRCKQQPLVLGDSRRRHGALVPSLVWRRLGLQEAWDLLEA